MHVVLHALAGVSVAVILFAGASKLIDLPFFAAQVKRLGVLPEWVGALGVAFVPVLEVALPCAWLMGVKRRACAALLIGLLAVFSVLLGWHMVLMQEPRCGCFGRLMSHWAFLEDGRWALARNGVMMICIAGWFATRGQPRLDGDRGRCV